DEPLTGYKQLKNNGTDLRPVYWNTTNNRDSIATSTGICVINSSSNSYYIPTRTYSEWRAFWGNMPPRVSASDSVGLPNGVCANGSCEGTEACDNNPVDCGSCGSDCPGIKIGYQCWASTNLNSGTQTAIYPGTQTAGQKYCYDDSSDNCNTYGGLYLWNVAMNGSTSEKAQGICPSGWHVPSQGDFNVLRNTVGDSHVYSTLYTPLGGWSISNDDEKNSEWLGESAFLLSSTVNGMPIGLQISPNNNASVQANTFGQTTDTGMSVRCLRDDWTTHYVLRYTAGVGGYISGNQVQTVLAGSSGTAVTAVNNGDCNFLEWSDSTPQNPRTENPRTDVANAHLNVNAIFYCGSFTLNYFLNAPGFGSISGATTQTVANGGSGSAVTATPPTGYYFQMWSDGITDNPRTDKNVKANVAVYPVFTQYWSCGMALIDDREGLNTVYQTTMIGSDCWMATDLNYGTKIISSQSVPTNQTNNGIVEKYCYNNSDANCSIKGGLYQWNEAINYDNRAFAGSRIQGICPSGWHLPLLGEIANLNSALGYYSPPPSAPNDNAAKLKLANFRPVGSLEGSNSTGFSAAGSGIRRITGQFDSLDGVVNYWLSTPSVSNAGWHMSIFSNLSDYIVNADFLYNIYGELDSDNDSEIAKYGMSVRCVKDSVINGTWCLNNSQCSGGQTCSGSFYCAGGGSCAGLDSGDCDSAGCTWMQDSGYCE
ncbi:MAG: FISUMP domain-containing protein, partial [Patescibacteria group bacterium]